MTYLIIGNCISVSLSTEDPYLTVFTLPDGYTIDTAHVLQATNVSSVYPGVDIYTDVVLRFPPINSKSPSVLHITKRDISAKGELRLLIEKFGQIPDPDYFEKTFDPILVTGDDGKEYNVIPSDQFK